jgi:hypothetical protein
MTAINRILRDSNSSLNIQTSSINKPSKPLYRSLSAPVVRSATPEVEEDKSIQDSTPAQSQYIFRSAAISEDLNDMWTLKRANPVFDEDDDEPMESPTKRTRTTLEGRDEVEASDRQILTWSAQIVEDENGFSIVL